MLALELATEKIFMIMDKRGLGEIGRPDSENQTSYLGNMRTDKRTNKVLGISELLTGVSDIHIEVILDANTIKSKTLHFLSNNLKKYPTTCTFSRLADLAGREKDDPVHGNHAYAIKEIKFKEYVIVSDPYNSSQNIKLSWDKFTSDVESLYVASENNNDKKALESNLPKNYDERYQKSLEDLHKSQEQTKLENKQREKRYKQEEINIEVKKINYNLETLRDDIRNNNKKYWFVPKNYFSFETYKYAMNQITKDNIITFLEQNPSIISLLDEYKSGLFNGNDKKSLIEPIITALIGKANDLGIESQKFKERCYKELDAIFYTDEQIIITEVNKLVQKIKEKEQ